MPHRLAQLLTSDVPDPVPGDAPLLVPTGMAAWVASRLPDGHAMRAALQPHRLSLLARQMVQRRNVVSLLAGLETAGVECVLLKGFMLAELAYPVPGARPYGDVDVLLHERDLPRLLEVAARLGWRDDGFSGNPGRWNHEIAHLYSPDGQVRLDVHRYLLYWAAGPNRRLLGLTRAFWAASVPVTLHGVRVRRPSWEDAALHVAVGRGWTGDAGDTRPADYVDLQVLLSLPGVTRGTVTARARALGVAWTWLTFLEGCDPYRREYRYGDATWAARVRRAALRDGSTYPFMLTFMRLHPRLLWRMALAAPDVLAAGLALRASRVSVKSGAGALRDPRELVRQMAQGTPPPAASLDPVLTQGIMQGTRWLTKLVYPRSPGVCVPLSLATFRALRRRGFPAVYVSGVRRTEDGGVIGHAWVEGPNGPLDDYGEPMNRFVYRPVFEERAGVP